eukprot:1688608-Amphidinium_carterae.1
MNYSPPQIASCITTHGYISHCQKSCGTPRQKEEAMRACTVIAGTKLLDKSLAVAIHDAAIDHPAGIPKAGNEVVRVGANLKAL